MEQPLQDSGLLYFCFSGFLMNCKEYCETSDRVLNVPANNVHEVIDCNSNQS